MDQYTEHCTQFTDLMEAKGYRGRFLADMKAGARGRAVFLDQLLLALAADFRHPKYADLALSIITHTPYDDIKVTFKVSYDRIKGFQVREQHISHNAPRPDIIRLHSNHEILASQTVIIRYYQPKRPWEDMLRGRLFRRR
ncbi:hypothetical protein [Chitinophaga rhizosphaerae]|uniref:hypothetical protein n=1 Tax=Chitinophaga rhizosphaerae TaxID=1864947 RepID=UPI000F814372|nr:hypothetical protein [Chitinophaga rhizosphaerae]